MAATAWLAALPLLTACGPRAQAPVGREVAPVLDFPEAGLDDPAAYAGYRTRFYRDAAGNTYQVYVAGADGRVVVLWADAANESLGFTARDAGGEPAPLAWGSAGARVGQAGGRRWVEWELSSEARELRLGLPVLGTMRFERDVQYQALHRGPLGASLQLPELVEMVTLVEALEPAERARHLALLRSDDVNELRSRLEPALSLERSAGAWRFMAHQPSFDGRGSLVLEISVDEAAVDAGLDGRVLVLQSRSRAPIRLTVRTTTDAPSLTPLERGDIFSTDFLRFLDTARVAASGGGAAAAERYRRLERQVRGAELLVSREKLMAGLPNFATYFGRDMLMAALMMESVWSPSMKEHVIGSALRKLGPDGGVSHEEALGGQAVRESAAEYNGLIRAWLDADGAARDPALLERARAVLDSMAVPRENHLMVDDDFQFPVVAARWLADDRIPAARKQAFLSGSAGPGLPARGTLLLRNLALVAHRAAPYAADPRATNLVSFPRAPDGSWFPGSWRDSRVGYGNGRYALDVNAIWVPHALEAMGSILASLSALGLQPDPEALDVPGSARVVEYARDGTALERDLTRWRGAAEHFMVGLDSAEVAAALERWLASVPPAEAAVWRDALATADGVRGLRFPALSLDSAGLPIPVLSTDPAMAIFLGGVTSSLGGLDPVELVSPMVEPYPLGLLIEGVGPVVANDIFASPAVQAAFRADAYHSPRVVWGREVNLLLLGLARRIGDAGAPSPDRAALREALARIQTAADASGLTHNELWSYRVDADGVEPVRYGTSSDVQLWNVTDLAVAYALERLPPR